MSLFNNPTHSDLVLTIDDGKTRTSIYAHSQILINHSHLFAGLLRFEDKSSAMAAKASGATNKEREYQLFIGEYGTVEECLDIIEHSIYGRREITYEQIQYQTNLLNYLSIDGVTYTKKYLTKTRFTIYSASLSTKSVILYDSSRRDAYMEFENDNLTNEHKLTISPMLCYNIEFLDYLASLIPNLNNEFADERRIKEIRKQGLLITRLSEIQKVIESLYAMNIVTDKNFPYANVLTKVIFDQGYSVIDPIYLRTKELSIVDIHIGYYGTWTGVTFNMIDKSEKKLAIFMVINRNDIDITIYIKNAKIDDTPSFFLVTEWIQIFFSLDLTKISDAGDFARIELLKIPTDIEGHMLNRQKVLAMLSYLHVSKSFRMIKTVGQFGDTVKYKLKNDLGLVFDSEYRSTNQY